MAQSESRFYKSTDTYHSPMLPNRRMEPTFNLRVPESKKTKDWYVDYMNYVVPSDTTTISDYEQMKRCYEIYNGDIRKLKQALLDFCNPVGDMGVDDIDDELIAYPKLHNKVNVLKGELLKRRDEHKVILLSAQAIREKNKELLERIKNSVDEKVLLEIKKFELQTKGMSPAQINEQIEQMRRAEEPKDLLRKDFLSEWEIFGNRVLRFAEYDQDLIRKRMETLEDLCVADRFFVYSGWKHGKPDLQIRNPLFVGFEKAPDEFRVQKSDFIFCRKPITIVDAYQEYGTLLEEDELQELGMYRHNVTIDKRHDVRGGLAVPVFDHIDEELFRSLEGFNVVNKDVGLHQGQGMSKQIPIRNLIWETHFEFKAFRELDFLSYLDEYNEEVTIMMEDFDIPEYARREKFTNKFGDTSFRYIWFDKVMQTEYKLERLWIPRKYEIVRLGNNIYPIYREVPFQTTDIDRPYSSFELSTKGAIFTSRNAKSVSLIQRAIPIYFQYLLLKHVQNRELAKYQGFIQSIDVDQIPDSLGEDADGNKIRDKVSAYFAFLRKTNKDLYSGSQTSQGGLPPATRSPGSGGYMLGTAVELLNLQQIIEFVDREMGMTMGVPPEREAQFSKGTNVTDNQQALVQSGHITEPYFFLHSEVWRSALNDYLINFRTYAERILEANPQKSEHFLHYFLQDGTEELLKITPKMLEHVSLGLQVSNSGGDKLYRDVMLNQIQMFSQGNAEGVEAISSLVKALSSNASPEEVHKLVQLETDKQSERAMKMEKMRIEAEANAKRDLKEYREDDQRHAIDLAVTKEVERRETELEKARIIADSRKDEGEDNTVQLAKLDQDKELAEKKMAQDKELAEEKMQQDKELGLKKIAKQGQKK